MNHSKQVEQLYRDFGTWIRQRFPYRVQKISVDAGFSCPNRDGRIGTGGCIYCDNRTFSPPYTTTLPDDDDELATTVRRTHDLLGKCLPVREQLEKGKEFFARKYPDMKYLAYFQSFTNTYAPLSTLISLYEEALSVPDVVGIVIGTRPDCVSDELLDYLSGLHDSFVLVEYGIESTLDSTLQLINRGHHFACTQKAIEATHQRGILCGGHVIIGLPGESREDIISQATTLSTLPLDILKIHQMQIIKGTKLAQEYEQHPFHVFTVEEYIELLGDYIQHLRPSLVLERFVSQSPASRLIAPRWGLKNHEFTHRLEKYMRENQLRQGGKYMKKTSSQ